MTFAFTTVAASIHRSSWLGKIIASKGLRLVALIFQSLFLPVSMFVRFGSFFTCAFDVKSLLFAITSIVSDSLGGSLIPKPFAFFSVFVVKA